MTLARGCVSTAGVSFILSSDNMAILACPEQVQEEILGPARTRPWRATAT